MDNKYIKKIREAAVKYQTLAEARKEAEKELQQRFKTGNLAQNDLNAQLGALKQRDEQTYMESIHAVRETISEYEAELDAWATLKGEDLTDDIKLLNSGISLSPEDYQKLEEKHAGNYSMIRSIRDSADKNKVNYPKAYVMDKQQKLEGMQRFIREAENVIRVANMGSPKGYRGALWESDEHFANTYSDLENTIALGKEKRQIIHSNGSVTWE